MDKNGCLELRTPQDGATVCFTSAVMAPLFPLAVFACCVLLEIYKPTSGITAGLQAQMRDSFLHPSSRFLRFFVELIFSNSDGSHAASVFFCKGFRITTTLFFTRRSEVVKLNGRVVGC